VTGQCPLEDRYRRLLALYPAEHRSAHEQEMLGVLMAGAHARQRRPGLAEYADLIWGALQIRLRPGRGGPAGPCWRDALAAVSVVLPLLFLLYFGAHGLLALASPIPDHALFAAFIRSDVETLGLWLILAALVLLRLRRTAALSAAGMLIWHASTSAGTPNWGYTGPQPMLISAALGLEIAALAASSGPRRGLQILTWKHYALTAVVAVTLGVTINTLWPSHPAVADAITITVIAVGTTGMAAASALSRRVMVLLSVLAYYLIVGLVVMPSIVSSDGGAVFESGWVGPLRITLTCLPLAAAIACLAITAALRSGHHTNPAEGQAAPLT
jgi:hypothetical protein